MTGSQTTTAAQQRLGGGALFDLRGNKRLFHLSRKMVVGQLSSDKNIIANLSHATIEPKQTIADKLDKPEEASNVSCLMLQRDLSAIRQDGEVPESQQVTEYSPDQFHRQPTLPAPHPSAEHDLK